jgi:hypothetical protein
MNVSGDQIRAATRDAARVITQDTVPPLRLDESPSAGRSRPRRKIRSAWIAPLAAAAAIILVAGGDVTAHALFGQHGVPRPSAAGTARSSSSSASRASSASGASSASSAASAPATGASADSYHSVPPYYVAVANSSQTVVRATWSGTTLARITTSTPVVGVAGAADGRTFVLDEQRSIMGGTVKWVGQPAFYLLRLTASGTEQSLTPLAVPAIPNGTVVSGLALSPDGTKLAVDVDSGSSPQSGSMEITTYTLATGASHSWTANGLTNPDAAFGFTGSGVDGAQSISWAANSRTLAVGVQNGLNTGVRLLDTAAAGTSLIADSRLAVTLQDPQDLLRLRDVGPPDYFASCTSDAMLSLDGSAIVCDYSTSVNKYTTMGFAEYSTRTGKMDHVLGLVHFTGQAPIGISLYWVNSTGSIAIGTSGSASGGRFGVMDGGKFTPLPGLTGFATIAW